MYINGFNSRYTDNVLEKKDIITIKVTKIVQCIYCYNVYILYVYMYIYLYR